MNPHATTRRTFLADTGMGFTGLALGAMLARDGLASAAPPAARPKAKSVIWIFLIGGVSHVESFDPKPALNRHAGKTIEDTPFKDVLNPDRSDIVSPVPNTGDRKVLMPLQTGYRKHGKCGLEVADWWQHVGACADDLAVVRSLWTTDNGHGGQLQWHTGRHVREGALPTLGAWACYGLGTLNRDLPEFVVLGQKPAGVGYGSDWAHGAGYLGPEHAGVHLNLDSTAPLAFGAPPPGLTPASQRDRLALLNRLHEQSRLAYPDDPALRARIQAYELAFRMQTSVPETLQLEKETAATRTLFGMDEDATRPFGRLCLVARRLVERGVRFVQIYHGANAGNGDWDAHSGIRASHTRLCGQVDRPIAGLLRDLKRRGLLDETLVVWGTEFGRSPGAQGDGRDHHPQGFCAWLAGGGIRGGTVHGATDEIGYHAVENRHYVTDIHATVLHQLGLDPRSLDVPGRKRTKLDHGQPIHAIFS